jgi:hypothetical protein
MNLAFCAESVNATICCGSSRDDAGGDVDGNLVVYVYAFYHHHHQTRKKNLVCAQKTLTGISNR